MAFDVGERLLERVFPKMRKTLLVILGLIIFGGYMLFGEDRIRYRLTYEFDTPRGPVSGGHVIEETRGIGGVVGRYSFHLRGEAAVIDLGAGRAIVALLAMGPRGEDIDGLRSLPFRIFGPFPQGKTEWDTVLPVDQPRETRWISTLVAFTDKQNPESARLVFPESAFTPDRALRTSDTPLDQLSSIFGEGYSFRRATITIVPIGVWPFSRYSMRWPRSLFGEQLTAGLDRALPWRTQQGRPDAKTLKAIQSRNWFIPEMAFKRT